MAKKGRVDKTPYIAAIDGIRGLSVIAVLFFHLGYSWMDGGFLGVEVFFVVSGYVITALLIRTYDKYKKLNRKQFYWRRIRRLMPAVYIVMAATIIAALFLAKEELEQLRQDVVASILYITNWHFIASDQAYYADVGRPSLLLHFWSLAIEEQFYLLWPMFALPLIHWFRRNKRVVVIIILAGALLSQLLAAIYYNEFGIDRAYYGTDSRLTGILLGCLLAFIFPPERAKKTVFTHKVDKFLHNFFASAATIAIVLFFILVDFESSFMYQYGFLLLGLITISLIALVAIPGSIVGKVMASSVMVWFGTRSYAIYLWHWPVFQFLRPGVDVTLSETTTTIVRLALSFALAELSYQLVEKVLRWKSGKPTFSIFRVKTAMVMVFIAVFVSLSFAVRPSVLNSEWPPKETALALAAVQGELGAEGEVSILEGSPKSSQIMKVTSDDQSYAWEKLGRIKGTVTVIGDSVTLGAGKTILKTIGKPVVLDASVSRFPHDLDTVIKRLKKQNKLGPTVVIALGTNGTMTLDIIEETMELIEKERRVVWVTPKGNRSWIRDSNRNLRGRVAKFDNAVLVDWEKYSRGKLNWFTYDGIHVEGSGIDNFAKALNKGVQGRAVPLQ